MKIKKNLSDEEMFKGYVEKKALKMLLMLMKK